MSIKNDPHCNSDTINVLGTAWGVDCIVKHAHTIMKRTDDCRLSFDKDLLWQGSWLLLLEIMEFFLSLFFVLDNGFGAWAGWPARLKAGWLHVAIGLHLLSFGGAG